MALATLDYAVISGLFAGGAVGLAAIKKAAPTVGGWLGSAWTWLTTSTKKAEAAVAHKVDALAADAEGAVAWTESEARAWFTAEVQPQLDIFNIRLAAVEGAVAKVTQMVEAHAPLVFGGAAKP